MKKTIIFFAILFFLLSITSSLFPDTARAVCPVCTVAVVAGLGVSRALGIDDIVTSIWIGGLILSASFWLIDWVKKRWPKWKFGTNVYWKWIVVIGMYLLVLVPLKLNHAIGILLNRLWGIDKIVLGVTIGSTAFLIGTWADKKIRKIKGKQLFIYQKVIFPVLSLVITSLIFYFIAR